MSEHEWEFVRKNSKGEAIFRKDTNETLEFVENYLQENNIKYCISEAASMLWIKNQEDREYVYYWTTGRWSRRKPKYKVHYHSNGIDDFVTRYSQMTGSEYTTGVSIDKIDGPNEGMQVGIAGYVKLRTPGDNVLTGELSTEMNNMHSDMVIAMHKDITLGGNCLGLAMTSSQNSLEFIQNGNFGVVQQMYSIKYDFQPSSNIT